LSVNPDYLSLVKCNAGYSHPLKDDLSPKLSDAELKKYLTSVDSNVLNKYSEKSDSSSRPSIVKIGKIRITV
jgi:hypothetical protein